MNLIRQKTIDKYKKLLDDNIDTLKDYTCVSGFNVSLFDLPASRGLMRGTVAFLSRDQESSHSAHT